MFIYRRALAYFQPFWRETGLAVGGSLAGIALNLAKPWPIALIIDQVLPASEAGRAGRVLFFCGLLAAIHLLGGLLALATNFLFVKVGLQGLLRLRTDLYAWLQGLPLKYHDARRSSDSSFRVAYDSQALQTIYNKGFTNVLTSGLTLLGTFGIIVFVDWQLTLVALGILPLVGWSIWFYAARIRRESTEIQERDSEVLAAVQEGLASVRMVHAFGREDLEVRQFSTRARQNLEAHLRLTWTNVVSALIIGTLMALGLAAMYYVGFLHVLNGSLKLGELTAFAVYLTMLYKPLEDLTYTAWALEGATAGARRCFEVLDRSQEGADRPHSIDWQGAIRELVFRDVSFGYAAQQPILHHVSLTIPAGQTVALVGGTGAGKSTLLSLVPRFYEPDAGALLLNGRDAREFTKKSLRQQISMVLQDTLLFSTTIRENIAYGRPEASEQEIVAAARSARAHDFIMQLPQGYASQVGERGGHLSAGQRQRIGIARAFLKDSPILLLDEPTSALDPATERAIMDAISELMRGRTTLIVTHRLTTIHGVDRIVVLENGRIAEQGRGPELLARQGAYARLFASGESTVGKPIS